MNCSFGFPSPRNFWSFSVRVVSNPRNASPSVPQVDVIIFPQKKWGKSEVATRLRESINGVCWNFYSNKKWISWYFIYIHLEFAWNVRSFLVRCGNLWLPVCEGVSTKTLQKGTLSKPHISSKLEARIVLHFTLPNKPSLKIGELPKIKRIIWTNERHQAVRFLISS